jgi:hypothetical protein
MATGVLALGCWQEVEGGFSLDKDEGGGYCTE